MEKKKAEQIILNSKIRKRYEWLDQSEKDEAIKIMHDFADQKNQELREENKTYRKGYEGMKEAFTKSREQNNELKAEVKRLRGGLRTITTNNHVDANSLQIANQLLKTSGENE